MFTAVAKDGASALHACARLMAKYTSMPGAVLFEIYGINDWTGTLHLAGELGPTCLESLWCRTFPHQNSLCWFPKLANMQVEDIVSALVQFVCRCANSCLCDWTTASERGTTNQIRVSNQCFFAIAQHYLVPPPAPSPPDHHLHRLGIACGTVLYIR